jgi:hypothetical protein
MVNFMKTSTATTLSVAVVISAATVAMAVNTNLFSTTTALAETQVTVPMARMIDQQANAEVSPLPDSAASTSPALTAAASSETDLPNPADVDASSPSLPVAPPALSTTTAKSTTYDLPGIGSVTLRQNEDSLTVEAVTTTSRFESEIQIQTGPRIQVEFRTTEAHYEFKAMTVDGRILTDISVHGFPKPGGLVSPSRSRYEDEDENDEYEKEDRDDDEHEDDEDGVENDD